MTCRKSGTVTEPSLLDIFKEYRRLITHWNSDRQTTALVSRYFYAIECNRLNSSWRGWQTEYRFLTKQSATQKPLAMSY